MRCPALTLCVLLVMVAPCLASTHVVSPDGAGDFPTIQAAVNAAADGDTVLLTDGTFEGTGNRDVDFLGKAVVIRSLSGDPETCVISCDGSEVEPHRGFVFQSEEGPDSALAGLTITGGRVEYYGGGVLCAHPASPTITDCIFLGNIAHTGGGLWAGSVSTVANCTFERNEATRGGGMAQATSGLFIDCHFNKNLATYGGGVYIRSSCSPTFEGCVFDDNLGSHSGGGFHIEQHCYPQLRHCTVLGNYSPIGGGIYISIESSPSLLNCTIVENASVYTGIVTCGELCFPVIGNSIICNNLEGAAVTCWDSAATLTCCDVYGNAGGDWTDCLESQYGTEGNICEDPLFCGDAHPDLPHALRSNSPCAPDGNPACGLIGAWDVACGPTAVRKATWGTIKGTFR